MAHGASRGKASASGAQAPLGVASTGGEDDGAPDGASTAAIAVFLPTACAVGQRISPAYAGFAAALAIVVSLAWLLLSYMRLA